MSFSGFLLKLFGWKTEITVPDYPKSIICVAPHTSNWDFVIGKLAYASVGRKAGFMMKREWFFFPLGLIFRAMGGIPVDRNKAKKGGSVDRVVDLFNSRETMNIAITPEGTRSRTEKWHTGFLVIARKANVPIVLAAFDFKRKLCIATETFTATGDDEADLRCIKEYYKQFTPCHPDKFSAD